MSRPVENEEDSLEDPINLFDYEHCRVFKYSEVKNVTIEDPGYCVDVALEANADNVSSSINTRPTNVVTAVNDHRKLVKEINEHCSSYIKKYERSESRKSVIVENKNKPLSTVETHIKSNANVMHSVENEVMIAKGITKYSNDIQKGKTFNSPGNKNKSPGVKMTQNVININEMNNRDINSKSINLKDQYTIRYNKGPKADIYESIIGKAYQNLKTLSKLPSTVGDINNSNSLNINKDINRNASAAGSRVHQASTSCTNYQIYDNNYVYKENARTIVKQKSNQNVANNYVTVNTGASKKCNKSSILNNQHLERVSSSSLNYSQAVSVPKDLRRCSKGAQICSSLFHVCNNSYNPIITKLGTRIPHYHKCSRIENKINKDSTTTLQLTPRKLPGEQINSKISQEIPKNSNIIKAPTLRINTISPSPSLLPIPVRITRVNDTIHPKECNNNIIPVHITNVNNSIEPTECNNNSILTTKIDNNSTLNYYYSGENASSNNLNKDILIPNKLKTEKLNTRYLVNCNITPTIDKQYNYINTHKIDTDKISDRILNGHPELLSRLERPAITQVGNEILTHDIHKMSCTDQTLDKHHKEPKTLPVPKQYSPPILPILSLERLQEIVDSNEYLDCNKYYCHLFCPVRNILQNREIYNRPDWVNLGNKRKRTEYDKDKNAKKISICEYKRRLSVKNINEAVDNIVMRPYSKKTTAGKLFLSKYTKNSGNDDVCYDSDVTVKL